MVPLRIVILKFFAIYLFSCVASYEYQPFLLADKAKKTKTNQNNPKYSKIVLPQKLRYLENMLNAEVVAKAAKIRQRIETNPNIQENEKSWPMLLAKYQADDNMFKNNNMQSNGYGIYNRRFGNRI